VAAAWERGGDEVECPATTLDALFAGWVRPDHRALLKLDLQGHELPALRGGTRLLASVEVVLTEVSFLEFEPGARPQFAELATALFDRGFELYDVLTLSSRPRDRRLRQGDVVFVNRTSPVLADRSWA
jgi:hypothetical protein